MQCVVLLAGAGMRMRPLTDTIPKPLVPILGVPLLTHILAALPSAVDELIFVVKYRHELLRTHYGTSHRGIRITYVMQGEMQGTGGALLSAAHLLRDRFLVMLGDDLHGKEALYALVEGEGLGLLGAVSATPQYFGVLSLSPHGTLISIEEKPEHPNSTLVNTGTMVLDERVFAYATPAVGTEVRLTDMVTLLAQEVPVRVVPQENWCPVGTPADIPRAEGFLAGEGRGNKSKVEGERGTNK